MSQARHRTVQVPGGSIYYRTCGTGPALLLMGGGPANADTLSSFASRLAQDYTVVSYDRRGYSRSRTPPSSPPSYATCYAGRPLAGRETPRSPRR